MIMKKSAFVLGMGVLLGSTQSMAHDHHHGKPLTEVERKASEGIIDDKDVKDRSLSDWDGIWQSLNPYLLNGDLDPVLEKKRSTATKRWRSTALTTKKAMRPTSIPSALKIM